MQNSPRSFQKFKKIPLFFSIVFLLASLFSFFFVYQQINNNKATSEQMQEEWETEAARRDQIDSLDRLIKSTETERASLQSHFAQSSDIVPFLDTLEQLATSVKVKSDVSSVDIVKDPNTVLEVQLKASGAFEAIYKFITLLENSPYELELVSVNIQNVNAPTTTGAQVGIPTWSADLKIKLLSFLP